MFWINRGMGCVGWSAGLGLGTRQAQTCSAIGDDDPLPGFSSSLKVFRVLQGVRDDGKMALSCAAGLDPWLRQGHGF